MSDEVGWGDNLDRESEGKGAGSQIFALRATKGNPGSRGLRYASPAHGGGQGEWG